MAAKEDKAVIFLKLFELQRTEVQDLVVRLLQLLGDSVALDLNVVSARQELITYAKANYPLVNLNSEVQALERDWTIAVDTQIDRTRRSTASGGGASRLGKQEQASYRELETNGARSRNTERGSNASVYEDTLGSRFKEIFTSK